MNSMMEYKGYHALIEYDSEDNLLVGEVFGITDSLSFHGKSIEEIRERFELCIDDYLQMCEEIGKEPNREFKGSFNVRISPALHREIALAAAKQKLTLNQYVATSLERSLSSKDNISSPTVIWIPYNSKTINLFADTGFSVGYQEDGRTINKGGDLSVCLNLSQ